MIVFVFVANIQSHKRSRFLDNVTLLSGHEVSFMHKKWHKIHCNVTAYETGV